MIKSLGPGLETTDFIRIALGSQHTFIVVQNSNLSKPLVITWPQLLQQIQAQLNIISGDSTIQVQDEGAIIDTTAQFLNFIGAGVNVTQNGNGVDITIPGGGTGSGVWGAITGTITNQTDLVSYVATQIATALVNYVPNSRTITINGDTKDLSADRTWTINIPTYTANNGVQPESGNPTNFELGGSIIKNTFIDVGPSNPGHDLQFDSNGPLGGSGKIKFTATTGTYSSTDKLVRFEATGAISAYVVADGTNGTGIFIQSLSSGAVPMIVSNASSAEILRMLNSGQLQLNLYNSSTAFSSGLTSVGILNVDNTGKVFVGAGGGGGTYTVDNGLSPQTTPSANPNNFQLGGPLVQDTVITNIGFYTLFTGALSGGSSTGILRAENSGSSPSFRANNTGNGNAIRAISNSGIAAYIQSTSNIAGYFFSQTQRGLYSESYGSYGGTISRLDVSQTGILGVLEVFRGSTGGAGLNNIGGSIDFKLAASNGGSISNNASKLISVLTDANISSLTSRFSINNINSNIDEEQFYILGSGQIGFNKYGQTPANFPGTPVWSLGVDANGKVVEFTASPTTGDSLSPFLLMGG